MSSGRRFLFRVLLVEIFPFYHFFEQGLILMYEIGSKLVLNDAFFNLPGRPKFSFVHFVVIYSDVVIMGT